MVYTDGSGGPAWALPALRQAGAGGAAVDLSGDPTRTGDPVIVRSVGLLFASVPGRQTVPRSETWAGALAVAQAPLAVRKWMCNASYVVNVCRPGATTARTSGANGDVWSELLRSLDLATQLRGPSKVRAHQSLDKVAQGKLSFASYFGNALADTAAELAAQRHQHPPPVQQEAEKGYALAVLLCRRLAAIEACCWQADAARLVPALHFEPIPPAPSAEVLVRQASKCVHEQGYR